MIQKGLVPILIGLLMIVVILFIPIPKYAVESNCGNLKQEGVYNNVCIPPKPDAPKVLVWTPSIAQLLYLKLTTSSRVPVETNLDPTLLDKNANWKTYTNNEFSFKYPGNWYSEENPQYPGGNNISFFLEATKADRGYADHIGNEVFSFELSEDQTELKDLKQQYYPDATDLTIVDKPAIRTSFDLYIIKISKDKTLKIVGGLKEGSKFTSDILSTFKFLDQE